MSKATKDFRTRGKEDCREFGVWYDYEDARRILWKTFARLTAPMQQRFLPPHVFFDGIDGRDIGEILNIAETWFFEKTRQSNARYFPFIFKPELAGAHYIAGVFVRVSDLGVKLVLFNPAGGINHVDLKNLNPLIDLKVSPHRLQTTEKDGGRLVSCGPLCLYFLEYILNHPEWLDTVDEKFNLPPELSQFGDETTYKAKVLSIRGSHDLLLQQVSDNDLETVEEFFSPFNAMLLDKLQLADRKKEIKRILDTDDQFLLLEEEQQYFQDDDEEDQNADLTSSGDSFFSAEEEAGEQVDEGLESPEAGRAEALIESKDEEAETTPLLPPQDTQSPSQILPVEEERPRPVLTERFDVKAVQAEMNRLRQKTGLFAWGCAEKINKIEQALAQAEAEGSSDVRLHETVRQALAAHRIGFFGKTQSLINVEQSLQKAPSYSSWV